MHKPMAGQWRGRISLFLLDYTLLHPQNTSDRAYIDPWRPLQDGTPNSLLLGQKSKNAQWGRCSGEVPGGVPDLPRTPTMNPEQHSSPIRLYLFSVTGFNQVGQAPAPPYLGENQRDRPPNSLNRRNDLQTYSPSS